MLNEKDLCNGLESNLNNFKVLAEKEFNARVEHMIKVNEFLLTKKFKLGQVVAVKCMVRNDEDNLVYVEKYGIVIRHSVPDGDYSGHTGTDYYRVHFDEKDSFNAKDESKIRALRDDEEIPPHFKSYDVNWCIGDYVGLIMTLKTFK